MRRILDLYDHPPVGGRVICVDEFGPLNLQPRPGRAWRFQGQPARLRATYTRDQGVRHMIAALDLATGRLHYRIRDRKRWREFLRFLKTLRRRWPDQKLSLICDNFSPHWIEAEFAAVRYFALNAIDHRSHTEQDAAIGGYIRWRNQRARPKSGFAAGSKIRHPDYPYWPDGQDGIRSWSSDD
ncbi:transposase [Micromonospora sp. NPDC048871]|uniref:transposase n=1 Tax=unclassified Micromonospora TaxID=2617518 RepID=UPI002E0FDA8D|nr:transposase [Micromonospora sp. NBC_01739]